MLKNSVYEQAEKFAEEKFSTHSVSALQLLYGYAKLVTMEKSVVGVLFTEEEQVELEAAGRMLEHNDIDVELLKQAAPLFSEAEDTTSDDVQKIVHDMRADDADKNSVHVLEKVLKLNIPELKVLTKGHNLSDAFALMDRMRQVAPPKNQPKEEAPRKEEPEQVAPTRKQTGPAATPTQGSASEDGANQAEASGEELSPSEKFQALIEKTNRLYSGLKSVVKGQDEAVRMFVQGYFQSEVLKNEEKDKKGPSASFLFAGPPGVGKTFLASTAAELIGLPYLRLDMSECYDEQGARTIAGVPEPYAGPRPGTLTSFVDKNPRCIVLLDEIEKAHETALYQFLQVLDGGILTDAFTKKTVDFSRSILIFTTNVGKSLYENRDRTNLSLIPRSVVIKAIGDETKPNGDPRIPGAMCSRFASGNLIMFNHLGVHHLVDIIQDNFKSYTGKVHNEYGYELEIDEKIPSVLLYNQSSGLDARNISAQSVLLLKNELYEFGRHVPNIQTSLSSLEKIKIGVDLANAPEDIRTLFENDKITEVLYFGDADRVKDVPFGNDCKVTMVTDIEEAKTDIEKGDFQFVVIDPLYGENENYKDYLSLDDRRSDGVRAFDAIREKFPVMPLYMAELDPIVTEDKSLFLEKGLRGFIPYNSNVEFADLISKVCRRIYLQENVDELSGRGRVLGFNSEQKLSEDGKTAEIIFYDFRTKIAADARENSMMVSDDQRPTERFDDVIGAKNAKEELKYFVDYMRNPKKFMAKRAKIPKGILLYGPPGTGKTMLARALAGESNVSFFPTSAAEFGDKWAGEGEKKIQQLFATAKKFAPSIIFIDEIDAIGKERTGDTQTSYTESLLNMLLTQMDGFEVNLAKPVFVIAATNFDLDGSQSGKHSRLDPALVRRFDNRIYVDLPEADEREEYLKLLTKKANAAFTEETLHNLAQRTTGQSLAILKNVFDLCLRNAERADREATDDDLLNALDEYMYGEKHDKYSEDYFKSVAIHESGHAYISNLSGEKPSFVTIVSRGNFGGYMQHANAEDTPSYTREDLIWLIRTSLAGRAAEMELIDEKDGVNTGVASDIQHATSYALQIICTYAMDEDSMVALSPETILQTPKAGELLDKVDKILKEEMVETRRLVREGRAKIEKLAAYLVEHNQATEAEIQKAFED